MGRQDGIACDGPRSARCITKRRLASLLLSTTVLCSASAFWTTDASAQRATPAAPASQAVSFAIPAQPLPSAINAFIRATGWQISYSSQLARGKTSAAVVGTLPPAQALQTLVAGTGLSVRIGGPGSAALIDSAPAGSAAAEGILLDPIEIRAQNPNAVLGTVPPPFAGGQVASGGRVGMLGNRSTMDTPFSQMSYTSQLAQNQQATTVADVIANDPSVRRSFAPSSFLDEYTIRGFTFYNRDIAFNGLYGMLPSNSIPVEIAERVEVLKGPNALLNGMAPSGSIGGGINIIPKRAGDKPLTQLTTGFTSNGQFNQHIDVGRRFGERKEFGVRINGVYRKGDTPVDNNSQEVGFATVGFDYATERFRFDADLGYQKRNVDAPQLLLFPGTVVPTIKAPSSTTNFSQPWTYYDTTHRFATARAELDISSSVTAYGAIGLSRQEADSIQTNWTLQNASGQIRATPSYLGSDDRVWTGEAGLRAAFDTGPVSHKVVLSYSKFDWDTYGVTLSATGGFVFSNVYKPTVLPRPTFPALGALPMQTQTKLSSVAIADTISMADERIQVTIGVRRQNVATASFNTASVITTAYDSVATTPAVGVVLRPWKFLSIYANHIEGLIPGPIAPTSAKNAGQVFPPFQSTQQEVGVKWERDGLGATLSAFKITLPSSFTIPTTNVFTVDGEQVNRGIEFTAFGQVTETVRVLGGVMYLDGEQTKTAGGLNDGKVAIAAPRWNVNLGGEWDTPFLDGLTLSARTIYTSAQYANATNTIDIPDWYRVDLGARYKTAINGMPVTLRANVENVFDSGYWASAARGRLIQGAPRTFFASASFEF